MLSRFFDPYKKKLLSEIAIYYIYYCYILFEIFMSDLLFVFLTHAWVTGNFLLWSSDKLS
jgi:hypothetical protein